MEKAQIVRYALMQVVALIYGVLASGTAVKLNKPMEDAGYVMPAAYYHAIIFRDYGIYLFAVIIVWTAVTAYLSSPFSSRQPSEVTLTISGIVLAIILAIAGTMMAFGGMFPPHPHLLAPLQ